jgi:perosamine synthetase
MTEFTGAKYAIATVNGTAALHIAMVAAGVKHGDEVLTQALTFIATTNAIAYTGAQPVFIDIDRNTLGMSAINLEAFLKKHAEKKGDLTYNTTTGKRIAACVPMHTFGFPCEIEKIAAVCNQWNIPLIEDAAESLGSYRNGKHTGTFGVTGTFSFNGNKTITCGGGGAVITDDEHLARHIKHLTTQAKTPHPWEFNHDHIGYNYRMPNLNAALACAQLEQLKNFVDNKRDLSARYKDFFQSLGIPFQLENENTKANYWLNAIFLKDKTTRDHFLKYTNDRKVMTRPAWTLMNRLPMFTHCQHDGLANSLWVEERLVNIPSSVRLKD